MRPARLCCGRTCKLNRTCSSYITVTRARIRRLRTAPLWPCDSCGAVTFALALAHARAHAPILLPSDKTESRLWCMSVLKKMICHEYLMLHKQCFRCGSVWMCMRGRAYGENGNRRACRQYTLPNSTLTHYACTTQNTKCKPMMLFKMSAHTRRKCDNTYFNIVK